MFFPPKSLKNITISTTICNEICYFREILVQVQKKEKDLHSHELLLDLGKQKDHMTKILQMKFNEI